MSPSNFTSEHFLRHDLDVPDADQRQFTESSDDYDRRTRDASEAAARRAQEVTERGRWQAKELLGADNWLALRRKMRDERLRFTDLLQPPADATAEFDKLSVARKQSVDSFVADLKVDTAALADIYRGVSAEVAALRPDVDATSGYASWLNSEHLDTVRDTTFNSAWQTFRPPFAGWQAGNTKFQYGFQVSVTQVHNESTGLVGNDVRLIDNDASDFDNGWAHADTQVEMWFLPPQTGVVEVVIEARNGQGLHSLRVIDEWGTSDSQTAQENLLMMHVLHPNVSQPSFAWMSRFNWNTDVSTNQSHQYLTQGGVYTARLFSDGPVPANQWVVVRAGSRTRDGSITNDMQINSASTFRWAIQAVSVRIA